jgi:hypothetical protein
MEWLIRFIDVTKNVIEEMETISKFLIREDWLFLFRVIYSIL